MTLPVEEQSELVHIVDGDGSVLPGGVAGQRLEAQLHPGTQGRGGMVVRVETEELALAVIQVAVRGLDMVQVNLGEHTRLLS